jgi:hypothetical protein
MLKRAFLNARIVSDFLVDGCRYDGRAIYDLVQKLSPQNNMQRRIPISGSAASSGTTRNLVAAGACRTLIQLAPTKLDL